MVPSVPRGRCSSFAHPGFGGGSKFKPQLSSFLAVCLGPSCFVSLNSHKAGMVPLGSQTYMRWCCRLKAPDQKLCTVTA